MAGITSHNIFVQFIGRRVVEIRHPPEHDKVMIIFNDGLWMEFPATKLSIKIPEELLDVDGNPVKQVVTQ